MDNVFRSTFKSKIKKSVADAIVVGGIEHNGFKGTARELFTGDMLVPVLPPEVRVGTGQLVAHNGQSSAQVDVILYSPSIMPPALFSVNTGLFPVEGALYTIEVKSRLTAAGVQEAIANARSIRGLPMLNSEHYSVREGKGNPARILTDTAYPVAALFAFGSDLTKDGKSELERYREYDSQADSEPAIGVICVVGKGYWYAKHGGGWRYMPPSTELGEVMMFLAGTTNTLPQLLAVKGRPRFGQYLTSEETNFQDI